MNTRRAAILILIAGLLGLHTVYTRQSALDYSLRSGQLYSAADRLTEEKLELEVKLSTIRQPVAAARYASRYCPNLAPAHPELAAYLHTEDVPTMVVPSLRQRQAEAAARNPQPAGDPAVAAVDPQYEQHRARQPVDVLETGVLPAGAAPVADLAAQPTLPIASPAAAPAIAPAALMTPPLPPVSAPSASSVSSVSSALAALAAPTAPTAPAAASSPSVPATDRPSRPVEPARSRPPLDDDTPGDLDAPAPVVWPEEPANDAPVLGCLPQPTPVVTSAPAARAIPKTMHRKVKIGGRGGPPQQQAGSLRYNQNRTVHCFGNYSSEATHG